MISVVQGKVGAGKSYRVADRSIRHLLGGGVVATNMALNLDKVRSVYHRRVASWQLVRVSAEFDPRKIPTGDRRGHGKRRVMVVLDEALNWFASEGRASNDEHKKRWQEWLRQSDKLGQDVVFIAQNFERAAKWIRELAQIAVDVVNFGQIRLWGMPLGKWCHLSRLCMAVEWDVRSHARLGVSLYSIGPRVWECYETSELYGFEAAASGYVATAWPAYRVPGVRLLWVPFVWLVVRLVAELFR